MSFDLNDEIDRGECLRLLEFCKKQAACPMTQTVRDPKASEAVQTTSDPAVDLPRLVRQFGGGGWVRREALWKWLAERGCEEGVKLHRDNWTDGQYHRQWKHVSGVTFDLNGNWYSAESFAPLIAWALSLPNQA